MQDWWAAEVRALLVVPLGDRSVNPRDPPYPAWTDVGVTKLYPPDAVVEISWVAVDPSRRR